VTFYNCHMGNCTDVHRVLLCAVGDGEGDGWGYDVFPFHDEEFSYALGAQVRTTTRTHAWDWFCVFELARAHLVVSRLPALTSVDLSGFTLPDMRSLCSLVSEDGIYWFADVLWLTPAG